MVTDQQDRFGYGDTLSLAIDHYSTMENVVISGLYPDWFDQPWPLDEEFTATAISGKNMTHAVGATEAEAIESLAIKNGWKPYNHP